jgi:predicted nucleic acid-binding protein
MLVIDASALLLALLPGDVEDARDRLADEAELHAPHLIDLEVANAARRLSRSGQLGANRAGALLDDLADLRIDRYPHLALLPRIWELRENLSSYDGAYLALAEALDAKLLTADARLARAAPESDRVELIGNA